MAHDPDKIKALEELLLELQGIINELKTEKEANEPEVKPQEQETTNFDLGIFFNQVRPSLFGGKLTKLQVSGMEAKLKAFQENRFPLSWAAYSLATSYHETAQRMQPVREGLSASDAWRKANLRYYPWYGRGDVQLTWEANYKRADAELGLGGKLIKNLDLALDPDISARIMIRGMTEGWFAGDSKGRHTLQRHLPNEIAKKSDFTSARRIINGVDKALAIAEQAMLFQEALKKAGY